MAEFQVTYWRTFPSMVVVRKGDDVVKVQLAARFQEAIDEAAMRLDAADADSYMEGWNKTSWEQRDGSPQDVAEAISADFEHEFTEERLAEMLDAL